MSTDTSAQAPSAVAMQRLLDGAGSLHKPHLARPVPGLPTLPDLKTLARQRVVQGQSVIDQSAGDIDEVGQPLTPEFAAFIEDARDQLVAAGATTFARTQGDAYGYSGSYQSQYPEG